jgi:hypothetical protein
MKIIIVIVVSVNILFSFYNWGIYAYNASQYSHNSNLLENSYKKNNTSEIEKTEYLTERKTLKLTWEANKKVWLLKLLIDIVVLT